jgi:hypothetical protein
MIGFRNETLADKEANAGVSTVQRKEMMIAWYGEGGSVGAEIRSPSMKMRVVRFRRELGHVGRNKRSALVSLVAWK